VTLQRADIQLEKRRAHIRLLSAQITAVIAVFIFARQ